MRRGKITAGYPGGEKSKTGGVAVTSHINTASIKEGGKTGNSKDSKHLLGRWGYRSQTIKKVGEKSRQKEKRPMIGTGTHTNSSSRVRRPKYNGKPGVF